MRGQTSIEYLVLTSFLLLVAGILFVYSFNSLTEADSFIKARNSVEALGKAAEQVSALGEGSQKIVDIELPENLVSFYTEQNTLMLWVSSNDVIHNFWFEATNDLTPVSLSSSKGFHRFKVSFFDGNVLISEVN